MAPDKTGENRLARLAGTLAELQSEIADLEAARASARTRIERRPINQRLHYLRGIARSLEGLPSGGV